MPTRPATNPAQTEFYQPSWINRRVALRHAPGDTTSGRVAARGFRLRRARVQDVSTHGMALILSQPLPLDTEVLIQLKNDLLDIAYDLSARVKNASRRNHRQWVVGVAFARELSVPELETLL